LERSYTTIFSVGVIVGLGFWLWWLYLAALAFWPILREWSVQEYDHPFGWLATATFWTAVLILLHRHAQQKKR